MSAVKRIYLNQTRQRRRHDSKENNASRDAVQALNLKSSDAGMLVRSTAL